MQVSTECDAHLAYDTQKTIDKVWACAFYLKLSIPAHASHYGMYAPYLRG